MKAAKTSQPATKNALVPRETSSFTPRPFHAPQEPQGEEDRKNHTGLPDQLKTGIENLSGVSLDDVKVHYDSPRPAGLDALAYTQGSQIHVGPGQEKHLPHEAWHVVQQKQGRVRAPLHKKGDVKINDNVALEREADAMGKAALATDREEFVQPASSFSGNRGGNDVVTDRTTGGVSQQTFQNPVIQREDGGSDDDEERKKKGKEEEHPSPSSSSNPEMIQKPVSRRQSEEAQPEQSQGETSDEEWQALEREAEEEGDIDWIEPVNWASDVIDDIEDGEYEDMDQSKVDFLQDVLKGLLDELETNRALVNGLSEEYKLHEKTLKEIDFDELAEYEENIQKLEEIQDILSGPGSEEDEQELEDLMGEQEMESSEEIDPEWAELEREAELLPSFSITEQMEAMYEASADRVIAIEDHLEDLKDRNEIIYEQIDILQHALRIASENEKKTGLISYKQGQQLKSGANKLLFAAEYLVPVAKTPIKVIDTIKNAVALAKTIKHIINLKKMLNKPGTKPENKELIRYAIQQKTKKSAKVGVKTIGGGALTRIYGGARALYKSAKGTKGVERKRMADVLYQRAMYELDPEAIEVVRELVGEGNMKTVRNPKDSQTAKDIIFDKLKSQ